MYNPEEPPVVCPEFNAKLRDPIHHYISIREVGGLRDAAYDRDLRYNSLGRRLRDEVVVVAGIDFGLRGIELSELKLSMFRLDDDELVIPGRIQKDYPDENISPSSATLRIDPYNHFGTSRLLKSYFASEWYQDQDTEYVFPTRQKDKMTTETIRNIVRGRSVCASATVHRSDGEPADPSELHPHALRHSLANYMLADSETRLVDVRNRLRHRSISTTE